MPVLRPSLIHAVPVVILWVRSTSRQQQLLLWLLQELLLPSTATAQFPAAVAAPMFWKLLASISASVGNGGRMYSANRHRISLRAKAARCHEICHRPAA